MNSVENHSSEFVLYFIIKKNVFKFLTKMKFSLWYSLFVKVRLKILSLNWSKILECIRCETLQIFLQSIMEKFVIENLKGRLIFSCLEDNEN